MKTKRQGKKYDAFGTRYAKTDWSLLPWREVEQIVRVLMFGAARYGRGDWQHFVRRLGNEERYFNAAIRHLVAWRSGSKKDQETNLPHLAHSLCCILFVLWKDNETNKHVKI